LREELLERLLDGALLLTTAFTLGRGGTPPLAGIASRGLPLARETGTDVLICLVLVATRPSAVAAILNLAQNCLR
jgi:hypothetical protein